MNWVYILSGVLAAGSVRLSRRRASLAGEILMTANGYLQLVFYVVVLIALAKPLGAYMARIYEGQPAVLNRIGAPFESLIYRVCGVDPAQDMRWTQYAVAVLVFNVVGFSCRVCVAAAADLPAAQSAEHGGRVARFVVQYRHQLCHQHQLAGLRR